TLNAKAALVAIDEVQRELVNLIEWQMGLNRGYAQILGPVWKRIRAIARAEGRPVRILDIGAGQGAVLRRLHKRGEREGKALELFAADLDPVYVAHVNERFTRDGVPIRAVVADACRMPEVADGAYDIAMHTFLFHHLTPERAAASLAEMDRVSRHGMYIFDLNRGPHVWLGMALGTAPTPHRHARALLHDGLASVRRAYTPGKVRWLLGELGLADRYQVKLQWSPPWMGFAWVLGGRG
ncbi:MAG: methyltransferase domain-containing protein, partial [Myxococcales bacterium]|nr:methyltransferase domain-containing protein [Myxococcales bacterium]